MNNQRKAFQLIVVGFILFVVLTVSIKSTYQSYYGFYYNNKEYEVPFVMKATNELHQFQPLRFFTSYTGFNTGYGFFAPNVASDFIFVFKIYNPQGQLVNVQETLKFDTKESAIRFSTFQTMFLEKLNDGTNEKYNRYLDIIIEQISQYLLDQYPPNFTIKTGLYLYDYPRVKEMMDGKTQPQLFLVKEYSL